METSGYLVFDAFPVDQLDKLRRDFLDTCHHFPEFKDASSNTKFVLGGFSALGNPGSFHNPFIRFVRLHVYKQVYPLLKKKNENLVQVLFDRMMVRPVGASPGRETWHRDITPDLPEADTVYGGWVNFDLEPQYFSCVPGSHNKTTNQTGFSPVTKQEAEEYKKLKRKIEIGPGQGILFRQDIVHEVLSTPAKKQQLRVFHGFRVTTDLNSPLNPLFENQNTIIDQGVPKIPSGQTPPMYSKQHIGLHTQKLLDFSDTLLEQCITTNNYVHRFMNSLKDYNLPLYPEYHKKEVSIFSFH